MNRHLLRKNHTHYSPRRSQNKDDLTYHMTAHLRMNAVYWGVTALCIMKHKDALDAEETIKYVMSCWDDEAGAFGAHPGHDAHILSTLSAIQVLATHDALARIDAPRVIDFILGLQQPSGIFTGDAFGETDTRFLYCAVSALSLLGALDRTRPRAHLWVCTAALAILDRLDVIDVSTLGWWLAERQLPNGGLNGRPEKLEDVCYSYWVLSSMAILNKLTWIDATALTRFIPLGSGDPDGGGIADRPGDMVDVFHTLFGVAGLSLLGYPGLEDLDPVYCMPASLIERLGLKKGWKALPRREA
ncbi:terpenoid cyclases/Protein prenyltransferase [Lactarius vividus]|nr:terpenoid cyclases/Protein prenyltransferase [Lactarius vividus]